MCEEKLNLTTASQPKSYKQSLLFKASTLYHQYNSMTTGENNGKPGPAKYIMIHTYIYILLSSWHLCTMGKEPNLHFVIISGNSLILAISLLKLVSTTLQPIVSN